jgi:molybdate transport system substrate-binding protein
MQEALGQILAEYALYDPAVRARAIYGASNELADHLLAGAPGDLFISADPAELGRLETAKMLSKDSRRTIARNGLAIVGARGAGTVKKLSDLLAVRFKRVALADPACPLGQYSKTYLEKADLYAKLLPKALHVDNSRAVLAAVVSGAAQAGVAFSSDAAARGAWTVQMRASPAQVAATYSAGIIYRGGEHTDARKLLAFVTSAAGAKCLRRCGLAPA